MPSGTVITKHNIKALTNCAIPLLPLIIKVMCPALHDSVVQAVQKQGGIRDQRAGGMHLLVSHTTCHIAIHHSSLSLSLSLSAICFYFIQHFPVQNKCRVVIKITSNNNCD